MTSARHREHRKAAARAGLRYVTDGFAGISRMRSGTGWAYYLPDGARIGDAATRKRLNALAIPPAWSDVWICPDPGGHIQATARDARGRKQYRYHPSYREARDHSKFRRMLEFSETLPYLRERVERDLRGEDLGRKQLLATVARLLDRTLIRVGNDEYARENRSYGLTTLRRRHVQVEGDRLRFSFRGKSGVEHSIAVADPRLARIIQRCQDLPGQEMFQYLDARKKRYIRFLEKTIRELVMRKIARPVDPTVAAYALLGMVNWTYQWFRPGGRLDEEQLADQMTDFYLHGLLRDDAAAAVAGPRRRARRPARRSA